jgi:hypothetical protein
MHAKSCPIQLVYGVALDTPAHCARRLPVYVRSSVRMRQGAAWDVAGRAAHLRSSPAALFVNSLTLCTIMDWTPQPLREPEDTTRGAVTTGNLSDVRRCACRQHSARANRRTTPTCSGNVAHARHADGRGQARVSERMRQHSHAKLHDICTRTGRLHSDVTPSPRPHERPPHGLDSRERGRHAGPSPFPVPARRASTSTRIRVRYM